MFHKEIPDAFSGVERIERRAANGMRQRLDRIGPMMAVALDGGEENFRLVPAWPVTQNADAVRIADDLRLGRAAVKSRPCVNRLLHRWRRARVAPRQGDRAAVVGNQRVSRAGEIVDGEGTRQRINVNKALRRDGGDGRDPVRKTGAEREGHARAVGEPGDINAMRVDGHGGLQTVQ